jgi:hypothetical protein
MRASWLFRHIAPLLCPWLLLAVESAALRECRRALITDYVKPPLTTGRSPTYDGLGYEPEKMVIYGNGQRLL